jgi:hypothetical protein
VVSSLTANDSCNCEKFGIVGHWFDLLRCLLPSVDEIQLELEHKSNELDDDNGMK